MRSQTKCLLIMGSFTSAFFLANTSLVQAACEIPQNCCVGYGCALGANGSGGAGGVAGVTDPGAAGVGIINEEVIYSTKSSNSAILQSWNTYVNSLFAGTAAGTIPPWSPRAQNSPAAKKDANELIEFSKSFGAPFPGKLVSQEIDIDKLAEALTSSGIIPKDVDSALIARNIFYAMKSDAFNSLLGGGFLVPLPGGTWFMWQYGGKVYILNHDAFQDLLAYGVNSLATATTGVVILAQSAQTGKWAIEGPTAIQASVYDHVVIPSHLTAENIFNLIRNGNVIPTNDPSNPAYIAWQNLAPLEVRQNAYIMWDSYEKFYSIRNDSDALYGALQSGASTDHSRSLLVADLDNPTWQSLFENGKETLAQKTTRLRWLARSEAPNASKPTQLTASDIFNPGTQIREIQCVGPCLPFIMKTADGREMRFESLEALQAYVTASLSTATTSAIANVPLRDTFYQGIYDLASAYYKFKYGDFGNGLTEEKRRAVHQSIIGSFEFIIGGGNKLGNVVTP